MAKQALGSIIRQEEVAPTFHYMEVMAPEIAAEARPGQFVQVKCSETYTPLLRKPISLHSIDALTGKIGFLYQVKGQGTKLLARMQSGQTIDLLGPLGNGFKQPEQHGKVVLVGGGIGIAPLLPLVQALHKSEQQVTVILGSNTSSQLLRIEEFAKYSHRLLLTTLDGSAGQKGLVTEPLEQELRLSGYTTIYTCGPEPMLRAVAGLAESCGLACQVSLEAYMACGTGACLGCACRIKEKEQEIYSRVCTEGPVFDSKVVIWHE